MRNVYRIKNKEGITLCFKTAGNESLAIDFAKMYGFFTAHSAEYVRTE